MLKQPSAKVLMSGEEMPILNDVGGVYTRQVCIEYFLQMNAFVLGFMTR